MNQVGFALRECPDDRSAALGVAVLAAASAGFLIWACLAPLSSAAVAPGEVRVESHRKTVEHLEGGIVRAILVKDGDEVHEGDVLAQLDTTVPQSNVEMVTRQRDALTAAEARLLAQREQRQEISWPSILVERADDPKVGATMAGQDKIFRSTQIALDTQTEILQQKIAQLGSEIVGHRAHVASLDNQRRLIAQEIKDARTLVDKGLAPKPKLLELERTAEDLEGTRAQDIASIAKAEQMTGETKMEIVKLRKDQDRDTAKELRETQERLSDVTEKLRQAEDVLSRTKIRAPQMGRVVNLKRFTPGGVLKPGEPLLDVVPGQDALIIECRVQPTDVDAVHKNLPAEVRLTAYKQRRTPTLRGHVVEVSADALADQKSDKTYYAAEVEIPRDQLAMVPDVRLYPGMPAEVMIVTGQRTAFQYLIDPVRDSFWRSFREK